LDATLNGGDDILNNSNSTHIDSLTAGDAYWVAFFGIVNGGDDEITLGGGRGGAGDVYEFFDGTVNGGDDVIFANGTACAGDVAYTTTGSSGTIRGGTDWMSGSAADDAMSGDVINISTSIPPVMTVIGGNDTLSGGGGSDSLYGERCRATSP
jgi:hypothetical protein